ncbi:RrF2 family transcriptional regulator [Paeniglutamicibacter cryotolerans]|uniref:Rrf2 family nitric oxide-sensitive transcriptional repressor n=1 Tax=Paeniglutamicibacter cryotolerans TaxID=670079 RepID=A0A839QI80_9MICC|nr:Rrf2 family transcriptional regulator [Paeniglutamicibacter cryotolerans]MBB2995323.1 Rrf2 family nitric oxide-sensitive transcriptional repressor [Paeniglutamicibacter cryotolerans]
MKLNAFADVCLRTLMLLGSRVETQLTTREIAEQIDIPYNHVSKAVLDLRNAGALEVTRGRLGGSRITEAGLDLSVGALLRRLDGHQDLVDCVTADGRSCPLLAGCRLRSALSRARQAFYAELDPLTVRELTSNPALVRLPFPLFS